MLEGIVSEFIGGAILVVLLSLVGKCWPVARCCLSALWRRSRPRLTADYAAAKAAPFSRKAVAGFLLVYGMGAVLSYGVMYDAAPLYVMCWFGSVWLSLWAYAGWLAVRWAWRMVR